MDIKQKQQTQDRYRKLIFFFLLLVGHLFLLGTQTYKAYNRVQLEEHLMLVGEQVEGEVVDVDKGRSVAFATYTFVMVDNQRVYEGREKTLSLFRGLQNPGKIYTHGDSVTVRFDPQDPNDSMIEGNQVFLGERNMAIIAALGVVVISIYFVGLWRGWIDQNW